MDSFVPVNPLDQVRRLRQAAFERSRTVFRETFDGRVALAIVSSYFPFNEQDDATPYVDYAQTTLEAYDKP